MRPATSNRLRRSIQTLLLIGALLLLAAACGGGGETTALSKTAFIKQGDLVCKNTDKAQAVALRQYFKEHPTGPAKNKQGQEEVVQVLMLPSLEAESEELSNLGLPAGDQQAEAIVTQLEDAVAAVKADPASFLGQQGSAPFTAVSKLARSYGFKACSEVL